MSDLLFETRCMMLQTPVNVSRSRSVNAIMKTKD